MYDYECCANCKHCDSLFGYTCQIKVLVIDDPYSDVCDNYEYGGDDDDEE